MTRTSGKATAMLERTREAEVLIAEKDSSEARARLNTTGAASTTPGSSE